MPFVTPKIGTKSKIQRLAKRYKRKRCSSLDMLRDMYVRKKIEVERKRKRGTPKNDEKTV